MSLSSATARAVLALLLVMPAAMPPAGAADATHLFGDVYLRTHDGLTLATTFFLPAHASGVNTVPFVLVAHDWGATRERTPVGVVDALLDEGYGVVTWDSRGFGQSGGEVMFDSMDHEVRDVSTLVDFLSARAPVLREGKDPVVGVTGTGYGGTVAFLAAARDPRIDAIAPQAAWHDLADALAPNGVPKTRDIALMLAVGQGVSCAGVPPPAMVYAPACLAPGIASWYAQILALDEVPDTVRGEMLTRSPAAYVEDVAAPTLLVHGVRDTLYDARQALLTFEALESRGVTTRLVLDDSTHGVTSDRARQELLDWFACHLRQPADCTSPQSGIAYLGGDGAWRETSAWPPFQFTSTKSVAALPPLQRAPLATGLTSHAVVLEAPSVAKLTAGSASVSFRVATHYTEAVVLASLAIRDVDGTVARIDGQAEPVRSRSSLSGSTTATLELPPVTGQVLPGQALVLLIETGDPAYTHARSPGSVVITDLRVTWTSL